MSTDYDDDDIEYYADLWGVSDEEAERYLDSIDGFFEEGIDYDDAGNPLDDGRPDPDYMEQLAEDFDIDISDLYDMYYGYNED